jgi:hypothetical protein
MILQRILNILGEPNFIKMVNSRISESKDIICQTHRPEINYQKHILYISMKLSLQKKKDKSTLLKEQSSMQIKIRHLPACLLPNRGGA